MPLLFARKAALTVGALRFTGLDISFSVLKSLSRDPNTATIQIFNLSDTSRGSVEQSGDQRVRLEAGYENDDGLWIIFDGELRKASSTRSGADTITSIEAGDGERSIRRARINQSFGPFTSLRTVLEAVAGSMGLGLGNLASFAATAQLAAGGSLFSEGTVVSGNPRDEMDGLMDSAGLEWSIQDGNIQILKLGRALNQTAIRLTAGTGLVESPSVDSEGLVKARALMIPGIFPGRKVEILSDFVRGVFKVEKATYTGDTTAGANEWYVDIECKVSSS